MADDYSELLQKLSDNISDMELKALVAACSDTIAAEDKERIKEHKDLFRHLEKVSKLGKDNFNYLEHALEKICRPDLVTQMLEYREKVTGIKEIKQENISGPARKYKGTDDTTNLEDSFAKITLAPPPSKLDVHKKS
ncbi:astrocytic phosphoprotein PEA-15-like [Ptychodera flava]|uniref:astrocytic phosphoprotein PEA-15-like n=1 Tax=Ptychodera flava TaxID=63121 RepID=UPI00396A23F3